VDTTDIGFLHFGELVSVVVVEDDITQGQIHPRVTVGQFSVHCLAVLQFNKDFLVFDAG